MNPLMLKITLSEFSRPGEEARSVQWFTGLDAYERLSVNARGQILEATVHDLIKKLDKEETCGTVDH